MPRNNQKPLFTEVPDFYEFMSQAIGSFSGRAVMPMYGFLGVNLQLPSGFPLKKRYKPLNEQVGMATAELHYLQGHRARLFAQEKILKNRLGGSEYEQDVGSVKLHVSINDIGTYDAGLIQDITRYMTQLQDTYPNMRYQFKLVAPQLVATQERFQKNDQFTIYFDKYSSVKEVFEFGRNLQAYLKSKGIPENKYPLGPKDIFALNSFVSVRADSNKLLNQYAVYSFFDRELQKFYEAYKDDLARLDKVPLAALETVFHSILIDKEIMDLPEVGLSEHDSKLVQARFDLVVLAPSRYLNNTLQLIHDSGIAGKYDPKFVDKFALQFTRFNHALHELQMKEDEFRERRKNLQLAEQIHALHSGLLELKAKLVLQKISFAEFETQGNALLDKARGSDLAKLRGMGKIFHAIAKAIVYILSFGQHSLVWKSDSVKKIEKLQAEIANIGFFATSPSPVNRNKSKVGCDNAEPDSPQPAAFDV